jgi:hypothetical protein
MSLSIRTILSRVFIVAFFLIFYFLGLLPHGTEGEGQKRMLETVVGSVNGTIVLQGR